MERCAPSPLAVGTQVPPPPPPGKTEGRPVRISSCEIDRLGMTTPDACNCVWLNQTITHAGAVILQIWAAYAQVFK